MRKIIRIFGIFVINFLLFSNYVYAAGYQLSVTSNTTTVGNTIILNIKVSEAAGKFTISSTNSAIVSVSKSSVWIDDKTESITLKANKVGTATITVTAVDVTANDFSSITGSKTVNITVNNPPTTKPKVYSSNNFLSSLSVEGLTLTETFDKEILEYSVTVPAETEKIKINAQVNDSSAKVAGTGEVSVSTGLNTFEIIVTAENGSKRTYVLKANVLELEPLKVTIDGKEYTIVRRRKDLPKISEYFIEKDILIGEDNIEGYVNEKLDYTLIGLKDSTGKIEYYIYKDNKYTLYKEYTFGALTLRVLDKALPNNYIKTSFNYGDDKIVSYQEAKLDVVKNAFNKIYEGISNNKYYLFYAINVENGKESLYQYDENEKSVQRYNVNLLDMYKKTNRMYYLCILGCLTFIILLVVCFGFVLSKKSKNKASKKKLNKHNMDFIDD